MLFLVVTMFLAATASAQIQVTESFANELEILGNISSGSAMNALGGEVPIHKLYKRTFKDRITYGILGQTSNRFSNDMEIALGTTVDETRQSVEALIHLMDAGKKGESITITDVEGRKYQIDWQSKNWVHVQLVQYADNEGLDDVVAGFISLSRRQLERALKILAEL